MDLDDRREDVFNRGCDDDGASLRADDRPYYLAQKFILDYEMGSLTGYLYNTLPDLAAGRAQAEALAEIGLVDMSRILSAALELFADYKDPDPPSTWEDVLRQYDPGDRIAELDRDIRQLANYGIDS